MNKGYSKPQERVKDYRKNIQIEQTKSGKYCVTVCCIPHTYSKDEDGFLLLSQKGFCFLKCELIAYSQQFVRNIFLKNINWHSLQESKRIYFSAGDLIIQHAKISKLQLRFYPTSLAQQWQCLLNYEANCLQFSVLQQRAKKFKLPIMTGLRNDRDIKLGSQNSMDQNPQKDKQAMLKLYSHEIDSLKKDYEQQLQGKQKNILKIADELNQEKKRFIKAEQEYSQTKKRYEEQVNELKKSIGKVGQEKKGLKLSNTQSTNITQSEKRTPENSEGIKKQLDQMQTQMNQQGQIIKQILQNQNKNERRVLDDKTQRQTLQPSRTIQNQQRTQKDQIEIMKIKGELKEKSEELEKLQGQSTVYKERLESEVNDLKQTIQERNDKINKLQSQQRTHKEGYSKASSKIKNLQTQLSSLKASIANTAQLQKVQVSNTKLIEHINTLQINLQTLKAEKAELEKIVSSEKEKAQLYAQKLEQQKSEVNVCQQQAQEARKRMQQLLQKVQRNEDQTKKISSQNDNVIDNLKRQLKEKEQQEFALTTKNAGYSQEINKLQNTKEDLTNKIQRYTQQIRQQNIQIEKAKLSMEKETEEKNKTKIECNQLERELATSKKETADKNEKISKFEAKNKKLESQVETSKRKIVELEETTKRLTEVNQKHQQRQKQLSQQLQKAVKDKQEELQRLADKMLGLSQSFEKQTQMRKIEIEQIEVISKEKIAQAENSSKERVAVVEQQMKQLREAEFLHILQGQILQSTHPGKAFFKQQVEKYTKKTMLMTKLLYRCDLENKKSFHHYIDGHNNVVLLVKLQNGRVIVGYSMGALSKDATTEGGLIISIDELKAFPLVKGKRSLTYDEFFFIYGNSEMRIKQGEMMFFTNFGIGTAHYNSRRENFQVLNGKGEKRELPMTDFEIYEVLFK